MDKRSLRVGVLSVSAFLTTVAGFADQSSDQQSEGPDCGRSLCGCWSDATRDIALKVTEADGSPIADARLICYDDQLPLGVADANGIVRMSVEGQLSPGCGFNPSCTVAYVSSAKDRNGHLIWFARVVRGEVSHTGNVELVVE